MSVLLKMSGVLVAWLGCILFAIYLPLALSAEAKPERAEIVYVNDKYIRNASITVRRTGRNSPYYIMLQGTTLSAAGDNVSLSSVLYEYLHNEYKRSFVEFDVHLCEVWNKEPWRSIIGTLLEAQGITCPLPPGTYKLNNITPLMKNFPSVFPFEKGMMEVYGVMHPSKEILCRVRVYGTIKKDIPKGKL